MSNSSLIPPQHSRVVVRQVREVLEWIGFETRNKYEIIGENQTPIGYAAEQGKGFLGSIARHFLGHWRRFEIHFFNTARQHVLTAHHPFRFLFQRMDVFTAQGAHLGSIQQRFAILSKKFSVENATGAVIMEMQSPLWRPWTFPLTQRGKEVARVEKKWSGAMSELFTDRDNFLLSFVGTQLSDNEKNIILVAALFIDLQYFEAKAGK